MPRFFKDNMVGAKNILIFWTLSHPDRPFRNFRASKSVDRRKLCSSLTSCDGFWSSRIVKGLVGNPGRIQTTFFISTWEMWNKFNFRNCRKLSQSLSIRSLTFMQRMGVLRVPLLYQPNVLKKKTWNIGVIIDSRPSSYISKSKKKVTTERTKQNNRFLKIMRPKIEACPVGYV